MTIAQRTQLDRAIDRAMKAGLEVVGHGFRKSDNAPLYAVPSQSEEGRWHIVILEGARLTCDCKARVLCAHKATVHMEMVVLAARREALAARVTQKLEEDAAKHPTLDLDECDDDVTYTAPAAGRIDADSAAIVEANTQAEVLLERVEAKLAKMERDAEAETVVQRLASEWQNGTSDDRKATGRSPKPRTDTREFSVFK